MDELRADRKTHRAAKSFFKRFGQLVDKSYLKKIEHLNKFYLDKSQLPAKTNLSDEENTRFDANRLQFICEALDFLCAYHITGKTPLVAKLSASEHQLFEGMVLQNCRYLIEHIAFTIFHLSGRLRKKYKSLLLPKPFSWETFEQLGGLM